MFQLPTPPKKSLGCSPIRHPAVWPGRPPHLRQKGHGTHPSGDLLAGRNAGAVGHDVGLQLLLTQPGFFKDPIEEVTGKYW